MKRHEDNPYVEVYIHSYKIVEKDAQFIRQLEKLLYSVVSDRLVTLEVGEHPNTYFLVSEEISETELKILYYELRRQCGTARVHQRKNPPVEEVYTTVTNEKKRFKAASRT